ncbi:MAG: hypothetical protein ACYDFT_06900 [Thermoplasmata archaeon]
MHRSLAAFAAVGLILALVLSMNAASLAVRPSGEIGPQIAPMVHVGAGSARVNAVNQYGGYSTGFQPGLSGGSVYFYAYDPSDSRATVTITDQNSTRDGIPNPAARWTVQFNASSTPPYTNLSTTWGAHYQIPFALATGGTWNISINGTNGGSYSTWFTVQTYTVSVFSDRSVYLPGEPAIVTYQATADVNDTPLRAIHSVQATAAYANSRFQNVAIFTHLNLTIEVTGDLNLTMPVNASPGSPVVVTIYMNQTGNVTESSAIYLYVGILQAPLLALHSCPDGCVTGTLVDNSVGILTVSAQMTSSGPRGPAVGATTHFVFSSAGHSLTSVPGSPPTSTTTNSSGETSVAFVANSTAFLPSKIDGVLVMVTDPWYLNATANATLNFSVIAVTPGLAGITVLLDQGQYFSGDTVTATWTIGGTPTSTFQGYRATQWFAVDSGTGGLLALGPISSTSDSGSFHFGLPVSFTGGLDVFVSASNQTGAISSEAYASVAAPTLLITPSELEYAPGDTITFQVTTAGSAFQGATLWASVTWSPSGSPLWTGIVSGGSFSIAVPRGATPSSLTASVVAQSSARGIIATNQITVTEASGYSLTAGVATSSQYVDDSFQPGETIQLQYAVLSFGAPAPSRSYTVIVVPIFSSPGGRLHETTSSSGTISYAIPSNAPAGIQIFEVYVDFGQCSTPGGCIVSTALSILVNPTPSILGYELGAGSGVTVGWTLLLVLIVVVAIVLVLMIRRRSSRPLLMSPTIRHEAPLGGGAEPASSPGAAPSNDSGINPWSEPGPTGIPAVPPSTDSPQGSPPLPNPPPRP